VCIAAQLQGGTYGTYCNLGDPNPGGAADGASCRSDTNCLIGRCLNGKCANPCCSDNDCFGLVCTPILQSDDSVVKLCVRPASLTAAADGAPCATGTDCTSGLCIGADPYQPSDAGYCSSVCCKDSDCPSIVAGSTCQLVDDGFTYPDGGNIGAMGACLKK
jgi:hypothetical protein